MVVEEIVIVGFGCIGQAVVPLLLRAFPLARMRVVDQTLDASRLALAQAYGLQTQEARITPDNHAEVLGPWLRPGTFLLNLAPSVCSLDMIALAQTHAALYLDTGIEPWDYQLQTPAQPLSNQALRAQMLDFAHGRETLPTALVAHGANPGMVSALVKEALLQLANRAGQAQEAVPATRAEWAALARQLQVQVIQISEYDSQVTATQPLPGEFFNTWSAEGFITECLQNAELGWGSHEKTPPALSGLPQASGSVVLPQAGLHTRVCSWSPTHGPFDAYLITHNESLSLADFLTCEAAAAPYRPTVYYAYRPTAATQAGMHWLQAHAQQPIERMHIMKDDIVEGVDELGVLLLSPLHGGLWLGSRLGIHHARALAPCNSATSLQVASSVVAAMEWASQNPARGVLEAEAIDHTVLVQAAHRWWAPVSSHFTDWLPQPGNPSLHFEQFLLPSAAHASP